MALKKKQIKELAQLILEDDTDSDDTLEYNEAFRSIIYGYEEDELNDKSLTDEDRKAVFAKCMKTFADPEMNAVYSLGFIRGLKDALEITEPVIITL